MCRKRQCHWRLTVYSDPGLCVPSDADHRLEEAQLLAHVNPTDGWTCYMCAGTTWQSRRPVQRNPGLSGLVAASGQVQQLIECRYEHPGHGRLSSSAQKHPGRLRCRTNSAWRPPGSTAHARLHYTRTTGLWTLYWPDHNLKYHRYRPLDPSLDTWRTKPLSAEADRTASLPRLGHRTAQPVTKPGLSCATSTSNNIAWCPRVGRPLWSGSRGVRDCW
jgi:Protein of unknown function (DUF3024)